VLLLLLLLCYGPDDVRCTAQVFIEYAIFAVVSLSSRYEAICSTQQ
jgi:hypothetical protein